MWLKEIVIIFCVVVVGVLLLGLIDLFVDYIYRKMSV